MGEIIDKAKGRIKQAVGDLTGNKRLKREGERANAGPSRRRGEGCEVRGQRKNPKLTQMFNKVSKGRKLPWIIPLIILIVVLFLVFSGGGGYYWSRRG